MKILLINGHGAGDNGWVTTNQANAGVNNIGTQFIVSPSKITSAVAVLINIYVAGRWTANSNIVSKRWTRTA